MDHKLIQIIVFIVNFTLWIAGALLIIFGGIAIGSPPTIISLLNLIPGVANVTNIFNVAPLFDGVADFMLTLGCVLFVFGIAGCHGVRKMIKRMIISYWVMLVIGVLTEIALIVYSAIFPGTMDVYVQQQMYSALLLEFQPVTIESNNSIILSSNISASSWEELQFQSQCCGAYNYSDYAKFSWPKSSLYPFELVPPSCCVNSLSSGAILTTTSQIVNINGCLNGTLQLNSVYTTGCWQNVMTMVWQFNYIAIIISACLMIAQIVTLFLTIYTWHLLVLEDSKETALKE